MQFSAGFVFVRYSSPVGRSFSKVGADRTPGGAESIDDFHDNVTSLTNGRNSPLLTSNRCTKSSTATDYKTNQHKIHENRTQQNQEAVRMLIVNGFDIGGGIDVSSAAERASN